MARLSSSERDTVLKGINMLRRINRELLDTYTVDIKTISDAEDVWREMKDVFGGKNFVERMNWYSDVIYKTDAELEADEEAKKQEEEKQEEENDDSL